MKDCTVLLLDDRTERSDENPQLQSISHGVVLLERLSLDYGIPRRRLSINKLRGAEFREGYHDFSIRPGGLKVYPRLVAAEHLQLLNSSKEVASGLPQLDSLLGGGVLRGTSMLLWVRPAPANRRWWGSMLWPRPGAAVPWPATSTKRLAPPSCCVLKDWEST